MSSDSSAAEKALRRQLSSLQTKHDLLKSRQSFLTEDITEIFGKVNFRLTPYKTRAKKQAKRYVNIMLSDLHYGADLNPEEDPIAYGTTEERRRTAFLAREVIEFKPHYRDNTELVVHLAGDLIQGKLHDLASAAPMAEQVTRAIYLLSSFLRRGVEHYPNVTVYCTPGNHGRIKDRHVDRAVQQKWDSFENIIYEALRIAFKGVPNIKFHIPKTPFYEYSLLGMKGFITHGDTVLNPGYPGRAINVARLESQVLKLKEARGDYKLVGVGHVHVPSVTHLPSTVLLTNGCLIPPDSFSQSIGTHSSACVQQMWETVDGYMFGDHRMLNVTTHTDNDKSLDAVIGPDIK